MTSFTKEEIIRFMEADILPLVAQQSGIGDRRYSLARAVLFVLKCRTEEHWGPKKLTMDVAMRLP